MAVLQGACIIGQSGGPTSVINASALGVIQTAFNSEQITRILGAKNGISGILKEELFDFSMEDPEELARLKYTPSSALGSCRYKLADVTEDASDYLRIAQIFQKYDVRYFFYLGGNDSMDTCNKISKYLSQINYECRVIGVPKTIDNDLVGTDHCPGYGSAAKLIANICMEINRDTQVYETPTVNIIEIMGRHAGWLAASSVLANVAGEGPDLIYLPERDFSLDQFYSDIQQVVAVKRHCVVAVSEGIHYADGSYINDVKTAAGDGFGHVQLGGLGVYLAELVKESLGYKARGIELSLLQRSAIHIASQTDIDEAYLAGETAVQAALSGMTDRMIGFRCTRDGGCYSCEPVAVPLADVANREKTVPLSWINEAGNGVTQEMIDYALPLIQGTPMAEQQDGLPRYAKLKMSPVQQDGGTL